jgi:hypothetical protein
MHNCIYTVPHGPHSHHYLHGTKQSHNDMMQIKRVLHELRDCMTTIMAVWNEFKGDDGDISFFASVTDPIATRALHEIRGSFKRLKLLGRKLDSLDKSHKESAEAVSPN